MLVCFTSIIKACNSRFKMLRRRRVTGECLSNAGTVRKMWKVFDGWCYRGKAAIKELIKVLIRYTRLRWKFGTRCDDEVGYRCACIIETDENLLCGWFNAKKILKRFANARKKMIYRANCTHHAARFAFLQINSIFQLFAPPFRWTRLVCWEGVVGTR